jgi:predicted nucleic acid-binding protein
VVLDTNILVSALIAPAGNPAAIYSAWEHGKFTLLTCTEHLDEVRATLQKPRVANLIKPYKAGRLVNQIKKLAEHVGQLPRLKRSPDPGDHYLLALEFRHLSPSGRLVGRNQSNSDKTKTESSGEHRRSGFHSTK